MAYDTATSTIVLFGGNLSDNLTWRWNGTKWKGLSTSNAPPPRAGASMAYDGATGTVLLFGGRSGNSFPGIDRNDTWSWNGTTKTWTQELPVLSPSPRWGAAMAYDEISGKVILFSGSSTFGREDDTWAWDGNAKSWTLVNAPAPTPPARQRGAMAYDKVSRKLVLFGGLDSSFQALNDTWVWNRETSNWVELDPATRPGGRQGPGLAYHKATQKLVMFGDLSGETWTFSGATGTWTLESPLRAPPGRFSPSMAPHPPTGTVVLFGGDNNGDWGDTWAWSGGNWKQKTL